MNSALPAAPLSPVLYQRRIARLESVEVEEVEEVERFDDDQPFNAVQVVRQRPMLELSCIVSGCDGLLKLRAPRCAEENLPILSDFVVVADVSGSMASGEKLERLQATLRWLIDNLSESQRMSIVTFNNRARRQTPLLVMNDEGKARQRDAVGDFYAIGGTNIASALEITSNVLEQRRTRPTVSVVILLTDGKDDPDSHPQEPLRALSRQALTCFMGIGEDHDARLLAELSDQAHGPFVYCETGEAIPEAVGGFLGAATKASAVGVKLLCGEKVVEFPLLTEEQEHFLLFSRRQDQTVAACVTYKEPGNDAEKVVELLVHPQDEEASYVEIVLIDTHKNREFCAKSIKEAAEHAQEHRLQEARQILQVAIRKMKESVSKDEAITKKLIADCEKTLEGMQNEEQYERGGGSQAAYSLMSSHNSQSSAVHNSPYATPSVRSSSKMASRSVNRK
jgi:uncharacterized protein YegL